MWFLLGRPNYKRAKHRQKLTRSNLLVRCKSSWILLFSSSLSHSPVNHLITFTFTVLQLERFRSLEDTDGNTLSHNFRPVQPIGDRIVWFTSENISQDDSELHDAIHGKKRGKNAAHLVRMNVSIMLVLVIVICASRHMLLWWDCSHFKFFP